MFSTLHLQARTKALCRAYFQDWGLVLIVLVGFGFIDQIEPYHRQFSVTDKSIQHPFAKQETVPAWMLGVLAFLVPAVLMSGIAVFYKRSYTDLHNALLGLMLTQSLVLIVTDSIKIAVGRPRPDFLDRCLSIYDNEAAGTPVGPLIDPINMLSTSAICTRQDLLRDGFKSFPSGHSSFSFGGLGFLAMYFAGKLHLFDERGHIYKSLVVLAPIIGASLIAASRVSDYRHHWQDVTVGSFIGAVAAVFSYRQYYPSLAALKSDSPFKPRVSDELFSSLPTHVGERYRDDDDEEGVARGSLEATARGEGRGLVPGLVGQFFRHDSPEGSHNGLDHHRQRQKPTNNNNSNGHLHESGSNGQSSNDTPNGSDARLIPV